MNNIELIREVAGELQPTTFADRSPLWRYRAAKDVVDMGGVCLAAADCEICAVCKEDALEDRLCQRYNQLTNGTMKANE